MQKELAKRFSAPPIYRRCVERCPHMLQPGASLNRANPKARVRFAQTQPPPVLGLLFITTEELDEKSAERFDGAPQALAREQRTKRRVRADTRVKLRR
jgi:hypothetical protein